MIKLLLVEDDTNLSYIVQSGLQDIIGGYEVITAFNGKEGLEAWKEHHPDIIISDIDMPVMDGFEMAGCTPACHPEDEGRNENPQRRKTVQVRLLYTGCRTCYLTQQ